jgi:Glycosyl hydrolase family 99
LEKNNSWENGFLGALSSGVANTNKDSSVKFRYIRFTAAIAFLLLSTAFVRSAQKPLLVHYMPWYVAKPFSGSWGWHWTMNHYQPDIISNGKRQIASWYYPLIGPYDSLDPAVLEYHVLLMRLAGVDGVTVDWYGPDNFNDYAINNQRSLALLNYTRKAGLKFSLCYEDQTIQQEINGNYITAAAAISHAQQTMLYVESNYFADASYLRLSNAPVFLNFGPQYFKNNSDWVSILSVLNATNQPAFFTEDNRLAVGLGAFDWPPMWMTGGGTNALTPAQLKSYLDSFDQKSASWPASIGSAFPRFHDIYAQAGVGSSYGYLDDAGGTTLSNTLTRAMTNNSALVHVVTWNDFGEGTMVEPTLDYGYRDLGMIQNFRRQYVDPDFSCTTNDLATAYRVYNLRKQYGTNAAISAELNRIFTNIVNGRISIANLQLTGIETSHPVIYDESANHAEMQFFIGGYVASTVQVDMSTDLTNWQTVQSYVGTTNLLVFVTNTQAVCLFFKVH